MNAKGLGGFCVGYHHWPSKKHPKIFKKKKNVRPAGIMEGGLNKRQKYSWNVDGNVLEALEDVGRDRERRNWDWGVPLLVAAAGGSAMELCGGLPWLVSHVMAWMAAHVVLSASSEVEVVVFDVARSFDVQSMASFLRQEYALRAKHGAGDAVVAEEANELLRRISVIRCSSLCELTCSVLLLREQVSLEPQRPRVVFVHGLYNFFWENKQIAKVRQTAPLPQGRCLDMMATLAQALSHLVRHKEAKVTVVMSRYHMFGASAAGKDTTDSSFLRNQWSSVVTTRMQVDQRSPDTADHEFTMSLIHSANKDADDEGAAVRNTSQSFRITADGSIVWGGI